MKRKTIFLFGTFDLFTGQKKFQSKSWNRNCLKSWRFNFYVCKVFTTPSPPERMEVLNEDFFFFYLLTYVQYLSWIYSFSRILHSYIRVFSFYLYVHRPLTFKFQSPSFWKSETFFFFFYGTFHYITLILQLFSKSVIYLSKNIVQTLFEWGFGDDQKFKFLKHSF